MPLMRGPPPQGMIAPPLPRPPPPPPMMMAPPMSGPPSAPHGSSWTAHETHAASGYFLSCNQLSGCFIHSRLPCTVKMVMSVSQLCF